MKHDLPRVVPFTVFIFLLLFTSQKLLAQSDPIGKNQKYKAAEVLRELQPTTNPAKSTNSAKSRTYATLAAGTSNFRKISALQVKEGFVAINAVSNLENGQELLGQLQQLGLENGSVYKRIVSGFFPIEKINQLEVIKSLNFATPAYVPQRNAGNVYSQGKNTVKAGEAQHSFHVTGVGSKIGIISDTYGSDKTEVATLDLPADVEILSDFEGGNDEGRAIAEIVHDVAPGAKIAFHSAYSGHAAFANGILNLAQAGCNIIMDDIMYLDEPMFQDGIIAQAVNEVVKRDVSYFSAAGNQARQSYHAKFKNSGIPVIYNGVDYGIAHDFGKGDITQTIHIPAGGTIQMPFQWDDPFYSVSGGAGARTDLDVLFFYEGVLLTSFSSLYSNEGGDPFEFISLGVENEVDIEIVIAKYSGPDPNLIKWVNYGNAFPTEHITNSSTLFGHANAEGTIAVGASMWYNSPVYNKKLKAPVVSFYSSLGGTPVVVAPNGSYLGTTANKNRKKPTIVGPDGGNTTFFGNDIPEDDDDHPNFFGTSAATPHVAAVAALMQEFSQKPLTPAAIEEVLIKSAVDMDDPGTSGFDTGYDALTGWGLVQADKALTIIAQQNCTASGTILREQYYGNNLAGKPLVSSLTSFEANNKGDFFTARILGYICPPQTGYYTFWLSGDDATRLILSTDAEPANARLIAYSTSRTNLREFNKGATQKSAPVFLQAGRRYYIEAQHVELWGGDHVTVAWQKPDGKFEGPIAGAHLSPFQPKTVTPVTMAVNPIPAEMLDKNGADATSNVKKTSITASPNPFSDKTIISFSAEEDSELLLDIITPQGGLVETLHQGKIKAGNTYEFLFEGNKYASGIYICRLTRNGQVEYKRLALVK